MRYSKPVDKWGQDAKCPSGMAVFAIAGDNPAFLYLGNLLSSCRSEHVNPGYASNSGIVSIFFVHVLYYRRMIFHAGKTGFRSCVKICLM